MNTTYETVILDILAPLHPSEQLKVLENVITVVRDYPKHKIEAYTKDVIELFPEIDTELRKILTHLFTIIDDDVVYFSSKELQSYILESNFRIDHVKAYLKKTGQKPTTTLRKKSPRFSKNGVIWLQHASRFYKFSRSDYQ